jgi:tripartite-type tricarboxylate transporter receptor subunit TctC
MIMSFASMRRLFCLALAALAASAFAGPSTAAEWTPTRSVRIIVPIVGGTNDVLARLVAPELEKAFGQAVIVENKGGAGGTIGTNEVARAAPDGQMLLVGYNGPIAVNATLFSKLPYDPVKDLAPVTLAVMAPQLLVVNPNVPVKNVAELVARAKATKMSYGSVSVGSASHLTMEMLKSAAHIDVTHVPYKGSAPAVTDLLGGQVDAAFLVPGNVLQLIKSGHLRAIASSGLKRFALTPDVPTMIEQGYTNFVAVAWIGFLLPGGTPQPIIDRYNTELVRILNLPEIKAKLQGMEFEVVAGSPDQFAQWIHDEIPRWGKVIKDIGVKVD